MCKRSKPLSQLLTFMIKMVMLLMPSTALCWVKEIKKDAELGLPLKSHT